MELQVNIFAVIANTALGIAFANVWWAPFLFGKVWFVQLSKYLKNPKNIFVLSSRRYAFFYIAIFLYALMFSYAFRVIQHYFPSINHNMLGIMMGIGLWIGIYLPNQIIEYVGKGRPLTISFIEGTFYLLLFLMMGCITGFFR